MTNAAHSRLPFGLAVAGRTPIPADHVDLTALVWDETQQVTLVRQDGVLVPWARHTDGQTSTNSNTDGNGGNEQDTDHRED
ncbi:hypothetical protein [Pseudonocardia sp. NPDC046786]|uniref:hypothetical protein n=1 Tax=Pseudonocardia sp. NPDC046786 TaxID=3155471 RepID=UPI0033CCD519